jgi:Gametolysin peptidase M11
MGPGPCGAWLDTHTSAPGYSTWPPYKILRVDSDKSLDRRAPSGRLRLPSSNPQNRPFQIPTTPTHTPRTSLCPYRDFVHTGSTRFDNLVSRAHLSIRIMRTTAVWTIAFLWAALCQSSSFAAVLDLEATNPSEDVAIAAPTQQDSAQPQHRNLGAVGSRTVMIFRVTSNAIGVPTISHDELYRAFFSDSNSLKHQMNRCSAGQLSLNPTNFGIMDIVIDGVSMGTSRADVVAVAEQAARAYVGNPANIRDIADHVVFVLPDRGDNFVGNAEICPNGVAGISSFGDKHAGHLSVIMHELGHNLNLNHAGYNGQEYADVTAMMGQSTAEVGAPLSCYNANNHWTLQWYGTERIDVNPGSGAQTVQVAAFVDSVRSNGATVLVKVNNYFLQYNRAKDFNAGTRAMANQLVIVSGSDSGGLTQLVTGLDMSNPTYNDGSVAIQVCSVGTTAAGVDVMNLSIGPGWTDCGSNNQAQQAAAPVPVPSPQSGGGWWGTTSGNTNTNNYQSSTSSTTSSWSSVSPFKTNSWW